MIHYEQPHRCKILNRDLITNGSRGSRCVSPRRDSIPVPDEDRLPRERPRESFDLCFVFLNSALSNKKAIYSKTDATWSQLRERANVSTFRAPWKQVASVEMWLCVWDISRWTTVDPANVAFSGSVNSIPRTLLSLSLPLFAVTGFYLSSVVRDSAFLRQHLRENICFSQFAAPAYSGRRRWRPDTAVSTGVGASCADCGSQRPLQSTRSFHCYHDDTKIDCD